MILTVIVFAFFAQRLISPADEENAPSYDQFLVLVEREPETVEEVTLDPDSTTIEVVERDGDEHESGYPPSGEESLVNALRRQGIRTVVEGSGGGSVLSWVTYLLPFLLFFGFWLFLMKRMQRRDGAETVPPGGRQPDRLTAVLDAPSAEEAVARVRDTLPRDSGYRVGQPRSWR